MPNTTIVPAGYVESDSGLVIPLADGRSSATRLPDVWGNFNHQSLVAQAKVTTIPNVGVFVKKDAETDITYWPSYGSGYDDILSRAITRGYMANGPTALPITMLSTIVSKRAQMASTWLTVARGKLSPLKKFLDVLSRADDSQFGSSLFVSRYIGALDVDNRGAIGSQVPIGNIDFDKWEQYGMTAVPIPGQKGKDKQYYELTMTDASFRENKGIWSIDGLQCSPTGNETYPYWIRKHSKELKKSVWVLIHKDFGFQIRQAAGGNDSYKPGFGQSGTWRISPFIVKHLAINQMDWEQLIAQPPRGIVWAAGLDNASQFHDQFSAYLNDREEGELKFYPGVFFGGSRSEKSSVKVMQWTEPPAGYTPQEWINEWVSNLASAFHMNETHLRLKLGEGALTQSGVAEALEAETSIAWMRAQIETIWNYVAPPRVLVNVIWQSDRTRRYQVETFREMSLAISRLQKQFPGAGTEEPPTFTRDEIRALVTDYIGIEIPDVEETTSASSKETPADVSERIFIRIDLNKLQPMALLQMNGRYATYLERSRFTDGAWVKWHGQNGQSLVSTSVLQSGWLLAPFVPHDSPGNDNLTGTNNTQPSTLSFRGDKEDTPLEPVADVTIYWEEAELEAAQLWDATMDEVGLL